jgi:hypothetical protein
VVHERGDSGYYAPSCNVSTSVVDAAMEYVLMTSDSLCNSLRLEFRCASNLLQPISRLSNNHGQCADDYPGAAESADGQSPISFLVSMLAVVSVRISWVFSLVLCVVPMLFNYIFPYIYFFSSMLTNKCRRRMPLRGLLRLYRPCEYHLRYTYETN